MLYYFEIIEKSLVNTEDGKFSTLALIEKITRAKKFNRPILQISTKFQENRFMNLMLFF